MKKYEICRSNGSELTMSLLNKSRVHSTKSNIFSKRKGEKNEENIINGIGDSYLLFTDSYLFSIRM